MTNSQNTLLKPKLNPAILEAINRMMEVRAKAQQKQLDRKSFLLYWVLWATFLFFQLKGNNKSTGWN